MITNSNNLNKLWGTVVEVNLDFIEVVSQGIALRGVSSSYQPQLGEVVTLTIPSTRFVISISNRDTDPYYGALHSVIGRVLGILNKEELLDY